MPAVKFTRALAQGDTGPDVEGVKRALARAGYLSGLRMLMSKALGFRRTFQPSTTKGLKRFQAARGLKADGVYGKATHAKLAPFFDAYAAALMGQWKPPSKQDAAFARLLASMQRMSDETPGYLLGGGHGVPLDRVRADQKLDCSSSTSKALYDAGLFEGHDIALVSGQFDEWGKPGKGSIFTVYYNDEHVWVRLHRTRWWRFDTSPHGDGGRGPRLRILPRFTSGFRTRHFEGM